jgi:hypothetical protein
MDRKHLTSSLSLIFISLLIVPTLSCKPHAATKVVKSYDGRFQVTVPGGWQEDNTLHKDADLEVAHHPTKMYLIILAESKEDLDHMTLQHHSDLTRNGLKESITLEQETGPVSLTIDGHPALQYEIRATTQNTKIVYLHTTVETPTYFYQILAWTIPSRYKKDPDTIKKITETFHELKS